MVFKYFVVFVHFRLSRSVTACTSAFDPNTLAANKMKLTGACVPSKNPAAALASGETAASCPVSCIASGATAFSNADPAIAAVATSATLAVKCDTSGGTWSIEYASGQFTSTGNVGEITRV